MTSLRFSASLDLFTKTITLLIISGVLLFCCFLVYDALVLASHPKDQLLKTGMCATLAFVMIIAWAFAPKYYSLSDTELIVHRPIRDAVFNRYDIKRAEKLEGKIITGFIRVFGVGGLFGYTGRFYSKKTGHVAFHATRRTNRVLITFKDDKKIVISPDDLALLDKINEKALDKPV